MTPPDIMGTIGQALPRSAVGPRDGGLSAKRERLLILAVLLTAAVLRLSFSSSVSGNDDLSVAGCALSLLDSGFALPVGHYCARFGITLPLAAILGLFGTGSAQISILPGLVSMAGILLAWRIGRALLGPAAGLAGAASLALFPLDIEFAGLAFSDALQGALMAGAVLALLRPGPGRAVLGGALWAWAYYVKVDAALLVLVIALAWRMGFVRLQDAVVAGLTAFGLVAFELVAYGVAAHRPFLRIALESAAANEVLGPGYDYRVLFAYPKAMFLVPYETGLHFWAWLLAAAMAWHTRSRPALLLVGWCGIWFLWLLLGSDPFSGFRLKPQIPRYLLAFAVPMAVVTGWLLVALWHRARIVAAVLALGAATATALFAPFNQLSYEAASATTAALRESLRNDWFPLYLDVQSIGIARFMLHGDPRAAQIHPAQRHNFLTGQTSFPAIEEAPSYLLVNEDYARRLQLRSLVRPIDPSGYGLRPTQVFQVDNPAPPVSYAALRVLNGAAALLPGPLSGSIGATAAEIERDGDARIWRLERP